MASRCLSRDLDGDSAQHGHSLTQKTLLAAVGSCCCPPISQIWIGPEQVEDLPRPRMWKGSKPRLRAGSGWLRGLAGARPLSLLAPSSLHAEKERHPKSQLLWRDGAPWVCRRDSRLVCHLGSPHLTGPLLSLRPHVKSTSWGRPGSPLASHLAPRSQSAPAPGTSGHSEGRWPAWRRHVS